MSSSVVIVQPYLMHYRVPVYEALAGHMKTVVACSRNDDAGNKDRAFTCVVVATKKIGPFYWQPGLMDLCKKNGATAVWLAADMHYLSSLALSLWCRLRGVKVILHGQGFFRNQSVSWFKKLTTSAWIGISSKYVAYTDLSARTLVENSIGKKKLTVISNRLEIPATDIASFSCPQESKGVLFVGRFRYRSGIPLLIEAMKRVNANRSEPLQLHLVGNGDDDQTVKEAAAQHEWLIWYGKVIDPEKLKVIAHQCSIGVYPGAAGLSILSYMGWGLPAVVGSDIRRHMGPEPSYVSDKFNGWHFRFDDVESLTETISQALDSKDLSTIQENAKRSFQKLHSRSYGSEMAALIEELCQPGDIHRHALSIDKSREADDPRSTEI